MGIIQENSGTFNGTSIAASLPATPGAGRTVIIICGNTTVTTPVGWTLDASSVANMGHYAYSRTSAPISVSITCGLGQGMWYMAEMDGAGGALDIGSAAHLASAATTYFTPNATLTTGPRTVFGSLGASGGTIQCRTISGWTNSFLEKADFCVAVGDDPMGAVATLDTVGNGVTVYSTTGTYSAAAMGDRSGLIVSYPVAASASASPTPPPPLYFMNPLLGFTNMPSYHGFKSIGLGDKTVVAGPQAYTQDLAANLSFIGDKNNSTASTLAAAALSFIGAEAESIKTKLTAALSFIGAESVLVRKLITGSLSFVGARTQFIKKGTSALLSFIGTHTKSTSHPLTGSLSFIGALSTAAVHHFTQALSGSLSFIGAVARGTSHPVSGSLSFSGAQSRLIGSIKTGSLSFTGVITRSIGTRLAGSLSFAGATGRAMKKILTGGLSFIGNLGSIFTRISGGVYLTTQTTGSSGGVSIQNQTIVASATAGHYLLLCYARSGGLATGAVTSITDTGGNTWAVLTRGALSGVTNTRVEVWGCEVAASPGTITVNSINAQTNAWSLTEWVGLDPVSPNDVMSPDNSGNTSSTTAATPVINTLNAKDLVVAVAHFTKATTSGLTAGFTALNDFDDGAAGSGRAAYQIVAATGAYNAQWTLGTAQGSGVATVSLKAAFVGSLFTQGLAGSLSFVGSLPRNIASHQTGSLSFIGTLARSTRHGLTATLSFIGASSRAVSTRLAGSLSFTGAVSRRVSHLFTASLSFVGSMTTAAVHFFTQSLTGSLNFVGNLASRSIFGKLLTASLSFAGAQARRVSHGMSGALSFVGAYAASTRRTLTGSLSFVGAVSRRTVHAFTASLSFVGNLTTQAVHVFTKALTGSLSFVGTLTTRHVFGKALTASLSFVGAQSRRVNKTVTATLSFVGTTGRAMKRTFTAALNFVGDLSIVSHLQQSLTTLRVRISGREPGNHASGREGSSGVGWESLSRIFGRRGAGTSGREPDDSVTGEEDGT